MSGLSTGSAIKRLPSSLTPYCICTSFVGRHASPRESAPTSWLVPLVRGESCRVNEAGLLAARAARDRYENDPSSFVGWFEMYASRRNTVVSLRDRKSVV